MCGEGFFSHFSEGHGEGYKENLSVVFMKGRQERFVGTAFSAIFLKGKEGGLGKSFSVVFM